MKASSAITQSIHNEFKEVFACIGCLNVMCSFQVKMKPNHIRCLEDVLNKYYNSSLRRNLTYYKNNKF